MRRASNRPSAFSSRGRSGPQAGGKVPREGGKVFKEWEEGENQRGGEVVNVLCTHLFTQQCLLIGAICQVFI